MNDITILRFIGIRRTKVKGVGTHLSHLDRMLLLRNHMTIIQMFYTTDATWHQSEKSVGKGKVIEIPILINANGQGQSQDFSNSRIAKFLKQTGAFRFTKMMLGSELSVVFQQLPITKKYYKPVLSPHVLRSIIRKVLEDHHVDLIINHAGLLHK